MPENNIAKEMQYVKYYLIDYENVHYTGLTGIEKLTENDRLIIFYTANAETLTFSVYEKLIACKAEIQLHKVQCGGKNALDFQLATFLGYILGKNPDTECHIISNDKGYEYVINFWKEKNANVNISSDVAGNIRNILPTITLLPASAVQTAKTVAKPAETAFNEAIKPLNLSKADKQKLLDIYNNASSVKDISKRKQYISNTIMKIFGNSKVKEYYNAIKPLIKQEI
ncbi:MAG: hypothetical protein K2K16_04125 [Ruminococcus sp.]|nr:hypothetical protein [Ruminococcus sp.]